MERTNHCPSLRKGLRDQQYSVPQSKSDKEKAKKRKAIDEEWFTESMRREIREERDFQSLMMFPFKRPPESIGPDDSPAEPLRAQTITETD